MPTVRLLDSTIRDTRFALRLLRKDRGFALVAVVTLGVAIGVNTAVFTLVDFMLLRPLPYPQPEQLAWVVSTSVETGVRRGNSQDGITWEEVRDSGATFARAVYSDWSSGVNLVTEAGAAYVGQQRVGAGYFAVLGVPPLLGREFDRLEDLPEGPAVAILSHRLWQSAYDGDDDVLGRTIMLRGEPHAVVGIMPADFRSSSDADVWTPLRASTEGEGAGTNYRILARIGGNTSWPEARAQLRAGSAGVNERYEGRRQPIELALAPLQEASTAAMRGSLQVLWAAVGAVLVIACVNLAGLLLVRGERRRQEIATRLAIGGGRGAVTRQLLVESLVIAGLGGILGVALASVTLETVTRAAGDILGVWRPVRLDLRVLGATGLITLLSALVFGLAPSFLTGSVDLRASLGTGSRSVARSTGLTRRLLLVGEVGLALVLLVAAGLLTRTFLHLQEQEPGFDPTATYAVRISLEDSRYATRVAAQRLLEEGVTRLREVPGVVAASAALGAPYQRLLNIGFRLPDVEEQPSPPITNLSYVTADFFATLRIPRLEGRTIAATDSADAPAVVVANRSFVETYLGAGNHLGRPITVSGRELELVGVVGNAQQEPGWARTSPISTTPTLYVPVSQTNDSMLQLVHTWFQPMWLVRFAAEAPGQLGLVQRTLEGVDPLLPLAGATSMAEMQRAPLGRQRLLAGLVGSLALTAVFLAALGIHGLVASSVAERRRELGLRMALGATGSRTLRGVVAPAVGLAACGALLGGAAALGVARALRSFLFGVSPVDPLTFVAVSLGLLAVAALAGLIPGLRVLRLDPASSLRAD